jgi:hypothetical protein
MTLEEMNIPPEIKKEAADLIRRIELADGLLELATAGGMTDGFIICINCLRFMRPKDVDELEILFSQAMDRKMAEARR